MSMFYDKNAKRLEAPLIPQAGGGQPHYLILTLEEVTLADGYDNDSKGTYWNVWELSDEQAWKEKIAALTLERKETFMPIVSYLPTVETLIKVNINTPTLK